MSCTSGCWGACASSCSSSNVTYEGAAQGKPNGEQYNYCWCGADCAGCGGCSGGCSGCSGDCTGCSGACGGSCTGTCTNGCSNTCTGDCKTGCKGTCKGYCKGGCNTACTGSCGHLCNTGCKSNVAIEAFKYLSAIKNGKEEDLNYLENQYNRDDLDLIDDLDIKFIIQLLQEEGRRRKEKVGKYDDSDDPSKSTVADKLSPAEEKDIGLNIKIPKTGQFADYDILATINNLMISNTGTRLTIDASQNDPMEKKLRLNLINKILNAYNKEIPINTTNNLAGKETD